MRDNGTWGGVYFIAFIGAAVYFVQQAHGFWGGAVGILKALAWPAMLIYQALVHLQA